MPYIWRDPDKFIAHHGVNVYHVYRNDQISGGRRSYLFTTDINGGDSDDPHAFDIRDLKSYDSSKDLDEIIKLAIENGEIKVCTTDDEDAASENSTNRFIVCYKSVAVTGACVIKTNPTDGISSDTNIEEVPDAEIFVGVFNAKTPSDAIKSAAKSENCHTDCLIAYSFD